jgi:hypothetical protein
MVRAEETFPGQPDQLPEKMTICVDPAYSSKRRRDAINLPQQRFLNDEARFKRSSPDWNKLLFERVLETERHGGRNL